MNILYVSPFSHGVNVSPILNIAHLVANKGHDVHFYTVKTPYVKFKDKNIKLVKVPQNVNMHYINNHFLISSVAYSFVNPIKVYNDLKNIIKKYNIDLVHFNFPEHMICAPLIKKHNFDIPTVLSINGIPGYDWFYDNKFVDSIGKIYSKYISSRIIENANAVITTSSKVRDTLNKMNLNVKLVDVSLYGGAYGIDSDYFHPVTCKMKIKLRKKYGLPKESFIIIYAGRLVKVKRLEIIIKNFNEIKNHIPNCFLLFVGEGPEKQKLIKLSEKNNIKNIKFIDFVNHNSLSELYASSDMFILLSSGEGNPAALREACSSGLPALVSNVGANRDIIKNNLNGYVVDELNRSDLINKINDIKLNQTLFSNTSRKIAVNEFSWEYLINNYIKVYGNLIGDKK